MLITISTRHGTISDQTRSKLEAKLGKFGRLFDQITSININVELENKARPQVDLLVSQRNLPDIASSFQADELVAAMDGAVHKLEQQLRKSKERTLDRYHASGTVELPDELAVPAEEQVE